MTTTTTTASTWEAAWAEYVEAMDTMAALKTTRFTRGGRRPYGKAKTAVRNAVKRLRKLDVEFCDRMGIE